MKITTDGARCSSADIKALFDKSDVLYTAKLSHTPFLVFEAQEDGAYHGFRVNVVICAARLLDYPDDTQVMVQWSGKWRSDFFLFTVADLRAWARDRQLEGDCFKWQVQP
jgi:hypothetical protein